VGLHLPELRDRRWLSGGGLLGFAGLDDRHFPQSFIFTLVAAPILARHRGDPNVQGFVKDAYAAAIGTILGACILLGRIIQSTAM
jgi:hypothetical protein